MLTRIFYFILYRLAPSINSELNKYKKPCKSQSAVQHFKIQDQFNLIKPCFRHRIESIRRQSRQNRL
jgi:hypothetical protein